MSWSKHENHAVETLYTSQAGDYDSLKDDLIEVVRRMLADKGGNTGETPLNILVYTNATNGYLDFSWYDPETSTATGDYAYQVELPVLWKDAQEHEDGSFHFDNETHIAICCTLEEFIDEINIYTSNELDSTPEILYI